MREKFVFSNGQDLSTLNTTGVVSEHTFDLEQDAVADMMQMGWINIIILATTNTAGTEGLWIELRTDDDIALNFGVNSEPQVAQTDEQIIAAIYLRADEVAAGVARSFGFCKAVLGSRMGLWYRAASTSFDNATTIDAWFSEQPVSVIGIQKKPVAFSG